jgi:hypothetical protein
MSRNNVFKLSGNMALGGADNYPSNDFENIKNSLKLLKSKQSQKRPEPTLEPTVSILISRMCTVVHTLQMLHKDNHQFREVVPVTYRSRRSGLPELWLPAEPAFAQPSTVPQGPRLPGRTTLPQ